MAELSVRALDWPLIFNVFIILSTFQRDDSKDDTIFFRELKKINVL